MRRLLNQAQERRCRRSSVARCAAGGSRAGRWRPANRGRGGFDAGRGQHGSRRGGGTETPDFPGETARALALASRRGMVPSTLVAAKAFSSEFPLDYIKAFILAVEGDWSSTVSHRPPYSCESLWRWATTQALRRRLSSSSVARDSLGLCSSARPCGRLRAGRLIRHSTLDEGGRRFFLTACSVSCSTISSRRCSTTWWWRSR